MHGVGLKIISANRNTLKYFDLVLREPAYGWLVPELLARGYKVSVMVKRTFPRACGTMARCRYRSGGCP
ncbi:MAG: hypothetical protein JRJ15_07260 [Deltaproteobacteria bacterium]|nr:hypothetical protein [Deltaproteobacteria bacterium]